MGDFDYRAKLEHDRKQAGRALAAVQKQINALKIEAVRLQGLIEYLNEELAKLDAPAAN